MAIVNQTVVRLRIHRYHQCLVEVDCFGATKPRKASKMSSRLLTMKVSQYLQQYSQCAPNHAFSLCKGVLLHLL